MRKLGMWIFELSLVAWALGIIVGFFWNGIPVDRMILPVGGMVAGIGLKYFSK